MTDSVPADDATLFPKTVGERLREAREAQGLSLEEIGARTRVPLRQLQAIEGDDYTGLPSVTYAIGFAKAYARAVGVDEVAVAREVRGTNAQTVQRTDYAAYEIDDPKRTPGSGLVIGSVVIVVLLLAAIGLRYGTSLFRGTEDTNAFNPVAASEIMPPAAPSPVPSAPPVVPATGQVVLTATGEVWMRVYDADGKTLFENTLKPGERFEVPADANTPMINVGRPDKLRVTLNGSAVPPLGDGRVAIKDVAIGAAALAARGATTTPAPVPSPAASATKRSAAIPRAFRAPAAAPSRAPVRQQSSVPTTPPQSVPAQAPPGAVAPAPAPAAAQTDAPTP